jgi:hypothetical protein
MPKNALDHITWIGGSPCSGKSSIADALIAAYGFQLYRCDDAYWQHAKIVTSEKQPVFHKLSQFSLYSDDLWMRPVGQQVEEEIALYREGEQGVEPRRRELARPNRQRWLTSGVWNGRAWDAFVAGTGCPVADLVEPGRPMQWAQARPILEQLARELKSGFDRIAS